MSSRRPRRAREAQEGSRSRLQPKKMQAGKPTSRLRRRAITAAVAKRHQEGGTSRNLPGRRETPTRSLRLPDGARQEGGTSRCFSRSNDITITDISTGYGNEHLRRADASQFVTLPREASPSGILSPLHYINITDLSLAVADVFDRRMNCGSRLLQRTNLSCVEDNLKESRGRPGWLDRELGSFRETILSLCASRDRIT